jgi:hypothetical protein
MKRYRRQFHWVHGILTGVACVLLAAGCYRYSGEIDPSLYDLRITEIQYHPLPDGELSEERLEFIELKNTGNATVDLSTCSFTEGISYVFRRGAHLAAGAFYVIASDRVGFTRRYGFAPDGVYDGKLGNAADTLVLTDDYTEEEVLSQPYADGNGWPVEADGDGYSLAPLKYDPPRNPTGSEQWRRSVRLHGSPGADDIPETLDPALHDLRITEIHYHPADPDSAGGDSLEFLELKNIGTAQLPLGKVVLSGGGTFTFDETAVLDAGAFFVIASNANGFERRYGRAPDGVYSGHLANSGETIILDAPASAAVLQQISYSDRSPWPEAADGDGYSLVPVKSAPSRNQNDPAAWRRSFALHGSPFADDPGVVLVNEVVSNAAGGDAIELYNPGDEPVDVSGWFLTDRRSDPLRYAIPAGAKIPARGYFVVTEEDITTGASVINPFSLSSHGDDVYVMANGGGCDSGYCHGFAFDAAEFDRSIGRYVTSIGKEVFVPQKAISLEEKNEGPLIGPVIVSELLLHSTDNRGDFIEVTNIELREIRLYDPENPENTWKIDGIDYSFPEGVSVKSGESVIIASKALSETDFRDRYSVVAATRIFFLSGTLPDDDVTLTLMKPGEPFVKDSLASTVPEVPFMYVDRIEYHSNQSWPAGVNGTGRSLHRISDSSFGDDPASWEAGDPDPGKRSW